MSVLGKRFGDSLKKDTVKVGRPKRRKNTLLTVDPPAPGTSPTSSSQNLSCYLFCKSKVRAFTQGIYLFKALLGGKILPQTKTDISAERSCCIRSQSKELKVSLSIWRWGDLTWNNMFSPRHLTARKISTNWRKFRKSNKIIGVGFVREN